MIGKFAEVNMDIIIKSKLGFTLMEVVVALAIFSVAATYSINIFVQSNMVQKKTANLQKSTSDARYALEVMARETRLGHVDYNYNGYSKPLNGPQEELALLDSENNPIRFRREETEDGRWAIQVCSGDACANNNYADITAADLSANKLAFYIYPYADPFVWNDGFGYQNNEQPRVTIVLEMVNLTNSAVSNAVVNLQTTVTERKYAR